ncbi:predicted protein [Aspergillus nidulans FGSC A4]|uniref:Uncharacterized protein n=1 Tax=Emericella nidulans (strain FGSC A4 / ATCC 38163 / CBS 112.46 / NRRL 194 / M139) TaxID=227321 RepID=Q5BDS6_EMENI|nr:hypothetical protein [Aspergillus nidulans FGSC A4]EAA65487.1 predicted protein [Aspergillus nidulans FGSC A4]CBF87751.1 TPA: conserved hypothetical protein [Aspergillus nidulans FGSC A4]|eukprot:XP_658908.1 predicted protein [Aspergillus nidulans FGSC A4]
MAAPNNQEPQSVSSRITKPIEHDKPTAFDIAGQYGPFLDSLRMTPQERQFLQDLLAVPQSESMESKGLDVVKRQHQDTSQTYRGLSHNERSSTSREARIFNTTSIFNGLELGEAKVKVYGNEIDSAPVAEKKYEDFHAKGASGFQLYIKSKFASPG